MPIETLTIFQGEDKFELPTSTQPWVLARDKGYSPVQMLVSAVAACGGYVYQSVLENSKISYEFKKVEASYTRDQEKKAEPIKTIELIFYLAVEQSDQERASRCLKLVSPNCPVIQSLDPQITVTETVHFI